MESCTERKSQTEQGLEGIGELELKQENIEKETEGVGDREREGERQKAEQKVGVGTR